MISARIPGPRVVERRVAVEEVPSGLQMSAYQSKDRVIVLISGTNRGEGFRTSLEADGRGYSPSLILHNTAPLDGCREGASSFSLSASVDLSQQALSNGRERLRCDGHSARERIRLSG